MTLAGTRISYESLALFDGVPAVETPADSALVKALEKLTGTSSGAVAFSTEAPFYNKLGMDSVVLGPGSINQAHQPNQTDRETDKGPCYSILYTGELIFMYYRRGAET